MVPVPLEEYVSLRVSKAILEGRLEHAEKQADLEKRNAILLARSVQKENEVKTLRETLTSLLLPGVSALPAPIPLTKTRLPDEDSNDSASKGKTTAGILIRHDDCITPEVSSNSTLNGPGPDGSVVKQHPIAHAQNGRPKAVPADIKSTIHSYQSFSNRIGQIDHAKDQWQHNKRHRDNFRQSLGIPYGSDPCEGLCDFYRYGIQFKPSYQISGFRHRVIFTHLPSSVTLKSVMDLIRGGALVECVLLDTSAIRGCGWSALVRFRREQAVRGIYRYYQDFPPTVGGQRVSVRPIATPSYPLPHKLRIAVHDHGNTRCLRVANVSLRKEVEADLQKAGLTEALILEYIGVVADALEIRFASVWYAMKALETLTWSGPDYQACFSEDPCSRPLPRLGQTAPVPPDQDAAQPRCHSVREPAHTAAPLALKKLKPAQSAQPPSSDINGSSETDTNRSANLHKPNPDLITLLSDSDEG